MAMNTLMHENNRWNHKAETNSTRGTSRSETINCPSRFSKLGSFKNPTQSYYYFNSSENESERVERKEKERFENI